MNNLSLSEAIGSELNDLPRHSGLSRLRTSFFNRPTLTVARDLLGTILVRQLKRHILSGQIVETEAYLGEDDPASHAFGGRTPRNQIMYGLPGHAYIYFIYGNHHCLNFVTEQEGYPAAVLVRALHPLSGVEIMQQNRGRVSIENLTNGPGKLCQALQIDGTLNGISLGSEQLYLLERREQPKNIAVSARIGVSQGRNNKWRFFLKNDPYVSNRKGAN